MLGEYETDVPDSDELGPGSDLVISMFALAMLVVAMIGSGLTRETPSPPIAEVTSKLEAAMHRINDLQVANAALVMATRPAPELASQLQAARQRINDLTIASLLLTKELDTARQKAAAQPDDSFLSLRDSAGTSYFPHGSADITDDGRALLLATLREKAETVLKNQFNTIAIEGYTSPDPRLTPAGVDTNEQLAFDRAAAVGRILMQAGISRRCIALVSYGRNRSDLLFGPNGIKPGGSEQDIAAFDRAYRAGQITFPESTIAAERRIDLRALADPRASYCPPSMLASQLAALR